MNRSFARYLRLLMMALILATSGSSPGFAQQGGADQGPSVLRDTETELLFKQMSKPLILAAGLDPNSVSVTLLNDPEINAFVSQGQTVYVQSGLLEAADNVNQLQGVVAHELGHVLAGDSIRSSQGVKQATSISILSLVLGAAAMAVGAGDAGMGIMMAGQRAAEGEFLAFTRSQEATADASGAIFLSKSGISGKGMLDFFNKLQNEEYRYGIYSKDSFDRDHPLSSERIEALEQKLKSDPAWGKPSDPALEARFQRVKAKLLGYIDPKQAVIKYPESDQSIPAHYARAYAYHLGGYPQKAVSEADALLAKDPHDPFFLELKGQILLEGGKPLEAIPVLREATHRSDNAPLIAAMLGHALVATDDPKNFTEAKQILKVAVNKDNEDPFAWYQLGIIYEHEGDQPRAALATAERMNLQGDAKMAYASAQLAMKGIPPNTPDYLRAQDIEMVSRAELAKKDKRYRDPKEQLK
ncbi:MAG TPA: M48 family metalloprotease [Sphingomicrobium sp.]|nr:M48 family metalloprotease [Sphingomicrobium sp.]